MGMMRHANPQLTFARYTDETQVGLRAAVETLPDLWTHVGTHGTDVSGQEQSTPVASAIGDSNWKRLKHNGIDAFSRALLHGVETAQKLPR